MLDYCDPLGEDYGRFVWRRLEDFAKLDLNDRYAVWQFMLKHFNQFYRLKNFRKGLAKFELYEHTLITYNRSGNFLLYTDMDVNLQEKSIVLCKKLTDSLYLSQRWANFVHTVVAFKFYWDEEWADIVDQDYDNYCNLMFYLGMQIKRAHRHCELYIANKKYQGKFEVDQDRHIVFKDIPNCADVIRYDNPYWGGRFFRAVGG